MNDLSSEEDLIFSLLEKTFTEIGNNELDVESYSILLQCAKDQYSLFKTDYHLPTIVDLTRLTDAVKKCFFKKLEEKYAQGNTPKIYSTNVFISSPGEETREKIVVGIAEIKFNFEEFFKKIEVDYGGLYRLKDEKIGEMIAMYVNAIEILEKNQKLDVVCFPELTCPPVDKLEPILKIAKEHDLYIIAGTFHRTDKLSNEAVIISPDGNLHYQKKFLKSDDEGIKPEAWGYLKVFNSRIGRFVVPICLDIELEGLSPLLTRMRNRCDGVDFIFNPSFHKSPGRAKSRLVNLSEDIMAVGTFVNGHIKGGSFIFDLSKKFFELETNVSVKVIDIRSIRDDRREQFPCRVSS